MNDRVTSVSLLGSDDKLDWPDDAVEVAKIGEAWGIKGGFKVLPFSGDPQALFGTKRWFLRPAEAQPGALVRPGAAAASAKTVAAKLAKPCAVKVKQAREQGDVVVVTAEGVDDRNQAEALRGARIFVSRSSFPTPDEDEFYWIDLIGLTVVNREGQVLGVVADLLETGPHCVLRCVDEQKVERLIPFVSAYIDKVNMAERQIIADWGLDF